MPVSIQIIILALIAAVVLFQLYNVLGKRVGRQPEDNLAEGKPTSTLGVPLPEPQREPGPVDPRLAEAMGPLKEADPAFDPVRFLDGARQAYVSIVTAYAAGDRETLRPLLAPAVMASFETGMAAREAEGRTERAEFLHPPRADLEATEVSAGLARAKVRFLAEIRTVAEAGGVSTESERRTAELWTFERRIQSGDPNWVLLRVEAAQA